MAYRSDIDNVDWYHGQHSVTFTKNGVSKNSWDDWGLIPSSRHSEPIEGIWSKEQAIDGINGQEDLVRMSPFISVNSYYNLKSILVSDNPDSILANSGYDIRQGAVGSLSFYIADQNVSFKAKEQEILNFLHNEQVTMKFADDPNKTYTVRASVDSFNSSSSYSNVNISYTILNE